MALARKIVNLFDKVFRKASSMDLETKTLICIPTLNEVDNIGLLVGEIFERCPNISIAVIDDQSVDGTANRVSELQGKFKNLHLISRTNPRSFAKSYLDGFMFGLERGFERILQMDADFSHHPKYISELLIQSENFDLVIGSRYVTGGAIANWPLLKRLLSLCGNMYCGFWLQTGIKDMTSGFNLWNKRAFEKIDFSLIKSNGYSFLTELKYQAFKRGLSITEVPILFEDRKAAKSKMSYKIILEAIVAIPKLWLSFQKM